MTSTPSGVPRGGAAWRLLVMAWALSLASTLGALFVGEVMGQTPCELCWFQRIAMFPLALLLGVASYFEDTGVVRYALPLAGAGWAVAAYHNLLYFELITPAIQPCGLGPSCSSAAMTILGGLPLPLLSLAAFTLIFALLVTLQRRSIR